MFHERDAGAPTTHGAVKAPTILVVDDDESIRESLVEALEAEGFDLLAAGDGAQALEVIASRRPDLVLLDLMMPKMSGWQVLDAVHGDRRMQGVPIFVVTAAQYAGSVATGYPTFVKPLNIERLSRTIRSFLI